MNHPILPVPLRLRSRNTVLGRQSSWNLHRSTIWSIEDHLEDLRMFVWSWSTSLSLICPEQQVSPCLVNNKKSSRPARHTYPLLLRKHWADWRRWQCEKHFDSLWMTTEVKGQISTSFAFQRSSSQSTGSTENGMSAFSKVEQHVFSDIIPFSIRLVRVWPVPFLFWSRSERRPMSLRESFCKSCGIRNT